ncbi:MULTISPECIES: DeoR/GlpR family DNA-binding transcription regulator [unclassified Duganella]|uniref:DeoR/GlpR family DNA-binding transcription regulator n=1 Tax=unclassified Duganella TaxID=2636909 RepID=UPI00087F7125|nr:MULTISPECIES: DeoR/GlpR family DNA-binding transcription regulator [unclassified Duganella]SDF65057.1 transcriptional regulator, DeoR family [Duganella sp. OV458]SDI63680.1 transcriptional regulator, DeoR family [Duganella sp. OV510]
MIKHKRRKRLLKLLAEHQSVTVPQLVTWLSSSPATVRRDIGWLAERNLLTRTRGGAANLQQKVRGLAHASETFQNNMQCHAERKRGIARHAASLCSDGETIIINGGTTTFMMAEFLVDHQLKILTNSFLMAERLLTTSANEIIVPGGKVYREQNVILSPFDNDITQHHYAAKIFMGVYGVSLLGLLEADPLLIQAEQRLINQAEQLIVLADSSKFSSKAGLILCGLQRVSIVITDTCASDAAVQQLEQNGVRVVTVEPEALPPVPAPTAFGNVFDVHLEDLYQPEISH